MNLLAIGGEIRMSKDTIQINEVYVTELSKITEITLESFKCMSCKQELNPAEEIFTECTECYHDVYLKDVGFVESKSSLVCKNCHEKKFDDETFIPLLDNLENMEVKC
jgi:hypothetical protein